jgi:5-methyltetrahydropteroyltriglutamate--homocysteine methyltransferase
LYTYFSDATPLYEKLMSLPVDILGFDLVSGPGLADAIAADGAAKPLALGMVSGRRSELEDVQAIAQTLDRVLPKIHGGRAYLGPSCGLEYLPRSAAYAKLELLPKIHSLLKA